MSTDLQMAWTDKVTSTSVTPQYPVGRRRFENGRVYIYQQASAIIAINSLVTLDAAGSADGLKVKPTAAAGDSVFGVAETAIASASYGWITVKGVASCLVATGTAADDPLSASATAGTAAKVAEAGTGDYKFVRISALEANAGAAAAKRVYIY